MSRTWAYLNAGFCTVSVIFLCVHSVLSQPFKANLDFEQSLLASIKEASVTERRAMLENTHRSLMSLPVGDNYLSALKKEVQDRRCVYAPSFPKRSGSAAADEKNIMHWFEHFPEEQAAYITYVNERVAYYSDKLTR